MYYISFKNARLHLYFLEYTCSLKFSLQVYSKMVSKCFNKMSQWFFHHHSFASYLEPVMQQYLPAWRSDSYRGKVIDVEHSDSNYSLVTLKLQRGWPVHTAGQHIQLTIENDGRLLTRTFTVASSPDVYKQEQKITLLIKRQKQGQFTGKLAEIIKIDQWLSISKAQGDFVLENNELPITMIAAGSGITPIISMLTQHLSTLKQPVYLRYIASHNQHYFVDLLSLLSVQFGHFEFDLVNREQHQNMPLFSKEQLQDVYCCGPASLMNNIKLKAQALGFNYFQEQFSLTPMVNLQQQKFKVALDTNELTVTNQRTLLEELEHQQQPVVRGCGIGVCHQCQCVKKKGIVKDIRTGDLSGAGEQLIQLCVSQPISDLELSI